METTVSLNTLVAEHPFLANFSPDFCDFLTGCAMVRRFASKQRVFEEGGEADHFYLIVTGSVLLETSVPEDGLVPIQSLGAGDALGLSWLFPPSRWQFSATTTAPTEVISFAAEAIRGKAAHDLEFSNELLTRVARTILQRLQATRRELVELHSPVLLSGDSSLPSHPQAKVTT
jgi:CRP/FNR family transcriptional regulator, cyclic AMP receptor protein